MNYFDIGIIVLVALFGLIGFMKGFYKTLSSLFGWLVSLVLAILLAKVVAGALLDIPFVSKIFVYNPDGGFSFSNWIYGILPDALKKIEMSEVRNLLMEGGAVKPDASSLLIEFVRGKNVLMGVFLELFESSYTSSLAGSEMLSYGFDNLAQPISLLLGNAMLVLCTGVALLILFKIITGILLSIFGRSMQKGQEPGIFSRLTGAVLGAFKGLCLCASLLVILSFMINYPFFAKPRQMLLEDESFIAGKFAHEVFNQTDKLLKTEDLSKLLEKSQFEKIADPVIEPYAFAHW